MKIILCLGLIGFALCIIAGVGRFIYLKKNNIDVRIYELLLFFIFPVVSGILFACVCRPDINSSLYQKILLIISIIFGVIGNYGMLRYIITKDNIRELKKQNFALKTEAELVQQTLKIQQNEQEYEAVQQEKFLKSIDELIANGGDISFEETSKTVCENTYINALMIEKLEECRKLGVQTDFSINIGNSVKLSSVDICSVLMNLIDNAINACRVFENDGKFIRLRAGMQGHMLIINIVNSADRNSQVPDKTRRHYGKQIIEEYVKKYDGYIKAHWDKKKSEYEVSAMLQEV